MIHFIYIYCTRKNIHEGGCKKKGLKGNILYFYLYFGLKN